MNISKKFLFWSLKGAFIRTLGNFFICPSIVISENFQSDQAQVSLVVGAVKARCLSSFHFTKTWDPELEAIAQRHADQCVFEHDCYLCKSTDRFRGVGQNLYVKGGARLNISRAIVAFYNEVLLFNSADVGKFQFSMETGHYTQVRVICFETPFTYEISTCPS